MKEISTALCKKFIVQHVQSNPGLVAAAMCIPDAETGPSLIEGNWKRISKRKCREGIFAGLWIREFDCEPFDDQLRARVVSSDEGITSIEVMGE
jgi:hypothetical protein